MSGLMECPWCRKVLRYIGITFIFQDGHKEDVMQCPVCKYETSRRIS